MLVNAETLLRASSSRMLSASALEVSTDSVLAPRRNIGILIF